MRSGLLKGDSSQVEITLNGLRLTMDLLAGQKTGGFLDQRENWPAPLRYLSPEAEALDVFTYQGGFALHLARHCRHVEAVDISRDALEHADANAQRNGLTNIDWIEANAFDLLRQYDDDGRRFDVVVLDPPAFAKSRSALATAERGYKEINLRAMKILRPGGMLVTCSCSHHMPEARLLDIVADAANDAHRAVTVVERRTQSLDHPILLTVPETSYLKCVLAVLR
jgi:23S rRNA (cytosine1962-C5)-methyltransferase